MEWISDPQAWVGFATLTVLEIVLGIDNIIFISILASKLPREQQGKARLIGLGLAMLMRIALLFSLSWVIGLTAPLFEVLGEEISGRDLVLLIGGLFLIGKATREIHERLEGEEGHASTRVAPSWPWRAGSRKSNVVAASGIACRSARTLTLLSCSRRWSSRLASNSQLSPKL